MNALALIPRDGAPPARQALISLNAKIADAERRLSTLQSGKAALAAELSRAAEAKSELQAIVDVEAKGLVERLRDGAQWLLSSYGNARARELAASLSESRIQAAVGERAVDAVGEEIATLEREISELKQRRPDAVRAVLRESARGYFEDYAATVDALREHMTILRGLEKALDVERIGRCVATVVDFTWKDGLNEEAVVATAAAISKAESVWRRYAAALVDDPAAPVDMLDFPVDPGADFGVTIYSELSKSERLRIDSRSAQGKPTQGVN
jgi:hypothetical protein